MMNLDAVRKTFTDWAPYYDATHSWTLPHRRESRLALGVQRGDRVLDMACGTGLNFPHLRELAGEGGHVLGIDLTPAMLDVARGRIARHGWKNVEVRQADAAQLPLSDASFDKGRCASANVGRARKLRSIRPKRCANYESTLTRTRPSTRNSTKGWPTARCKRCRWSPKR